MKDKLDILLDLIKPKPGVNVYGQPFEDILWPISNNIDAFLFLYESMPEDVRPNLLTCSSNFRDTFLNVITKADEKTFNNYFFSGMHELFDTDKIRELHFKLPNNSQLKEYWKNKDKPVNIDEVVDFLATLWFNNSDSYPEMLEQYRPKLKNLSKITSEKSRAADYFSSWNKAIIKKDGLEAAFDFCSHIQVEPISFCINTKNTLGLDIRTISQDELEFLVKYGQNLVDSGKHPKIKNSFQAVEIACFYSRQEPMVMQALKELTETNTPDLKKIGYIWTVQQDYIKNTLKIWLSKFTRTNVENMSINRLVKKIDSVAFQGSTWSSTLGITKDSFQKIIQLGSIAELENELPINSNSQNTKKLKI